MQNLDHKLALEGRILKIAETAAETPGTHQELILQMHQIRRALLDLVAELIEQEEFCLADLPVSPLPVASGPGQDDRFRQQDRTIGVVVQQLQRYRDDVQVVKQRSRSLRDRLHREVLALRDENRRLELWVTFLEQKAREAGWLLQKKA